MSLFRDDRTIGKWTNGKIELTGKWIYHWSANRFQIWLDSNDEITGNQRIFTVYGDTPEWGKWKLVKETAQ